MQTDETVLCDGCGVEILWPPVTNNSRNYCCHDCLDGYECNCGARAEEEQYTRSGNSAGQQINSY